MGSRMADLGSSMMSAQAKDIYTGGTHIRNEIAIDEHSRLELKQLSMFVEGLGELTDLVIRTPAVDRDLERRSGV